MKVLATLAAIVVTLTLLSGCEDGDARQRAEIQKALTEATKELQKATAGNFDPGSEDADKARASLDRAIKTLNGINPTDDGQKAAKALLTAGALREAAYMDLAKAAMIESQQKAAREETSTKIDAIASLAAIADGQQKINPAADTEILEKDRQASLQRIDELSKRIEQLAGPIGERTSANDTAKQEVERLKTEVNDLRRKASELGNANGFATYQQAVETRRKADKIEYDISQREMELGYSLQPDHDLADVESRHLQNRVTTLQGTRQELDAFAKTTSDSIAATRQEIATLAGDVTASLKKLTDTATTELAPLYEQAEASLQKAAAMAGAGGASSAEDMGVARLLKARILELQGKFNALKASSLADQKALLQKLNDAGKSMPSSADIKSQLDAATTEWTAAVEKAKASFTEAMDALSQVKSRDDAVELFRKNLESAVAVMSGKKVEPDVSTAPSSASSEAPAAAVPRPANIGSKRGFASPEALIEHGKSLVKQKDPMDTLRGLLEMTYAETPDGQAMSASVNDMISSIDLLIKAMGRKFGQQMSDAMSTGGAASMVAAMPSFDGATVSERTETTAVIMASRRGVPAQVALKNVGGKWYIDGDTVSDRRNAQQQVRGAAKFKATIEGIVQQMNAGTLNDPKQIIDEVQSAFQNLDSP